MPRSLQSVLAIAAGAAVLHACSNNPAGPPPVPAAAPSTMTLSTADTVPIGSETVHPLEDAGCPVAFTVYDGDGDVGGSAGTEDDLIHKTALDRNNRRFEFWNIDGHHFAARYVQVDASGTVIDEKWVGVCAYGWGNSGWNLTKRTYPDGSFEWTRSHYANFDEGGDDDGDGKEDAATYEFDVDAMTLTQSHLENLTVKKSRVMTGNGIPGDPASTTDDAWDLVGWGIGTEDPDGHPTPAPHRSTSCGGGGGGSSRARAPERRQTAQPNDDGAAPGSHRSPKR